LHEDEISRLELREDLVPPPLGQEGATAAPADGAVDDVDLLRIKVCCDRIAPSLLARRGRSHGRIADNEKGWKARVDLLLLCRRNDGQDDDEERNQECSPHFKIPPFR